VHSSSEHRRRQEVKHVGRGCSRGRHGDAVVYDFGHPHAAGHVVSVPGSRSPCLQRLVHWRKFDQWVFSRVFCRFLESTLNSLPELSNSCPWRDPSDVGHAYGAGVTNMRCLPPTKVVVKVVVVVVVVTFFNHNFVNWKATSILAIKNVRNKGQNNITYCTSEWMTCCQRTTLVFIAIAKTPFRTWEPNIIRQISYVTQKA